MIHLIYLNGHYFNRACFGFIHYSIFLLKQFIKSFSLIDSLRPKQNERHFTDDIFKRIFLNENIWIPIKISLKCVPDGSINNIPASVQIMAWRRQAIIWTNDG